MDLIILHVHLIRIEYIHLSQSRCLCMALPYIFFLSKSHGRLTSLFTSCLFVFCEGRLCNWSYLSTSPFSYLSTPILSVELETILLTQPDLILTNIFVPHCCILLKAWPSLRLVDQVHCLLTRAYSWSSSSSHAALLVYWPALSKCFPSQDHIITMQYRNASIAVMVGI